VRGLIAETFSLLGNRGLRMALVAAVLLVPAELALAHAHGDSEMLGLAATAFVSLIAYPWAFGAVYSLLGRPTGGVFTPYGAVLERAPALVAQNVLVGVSILIALLLLILPGVLLCARWSAAGALVVLDGHGPIKALGVSNGLVRGRTWTVAGAGVVIALVAFALAVPGFVVTETTSNEWVDGVGEAAIDLGLFLPLIAFAYVVYRSVRS
jgi:hypothetical protein